MPNLRDIRHRIKSIRNTAKITKAMQMVAASKMRRAQQAAIAARPYAELTNKILAHCTGAVEEHAHPLLEHRPVRHTGVLLISTDRGLCGSLNTNLFREVMHYDRATTQFVVTGRKGAAFLARAGYQLVADFEMKENPTLLYTKRMSEFLIERFLKGEIDRMDVIYSEFVTTARQQATRRQILPIQELRALSVELDGDQEKQEAPIAADRSVEPIFEPSAGDVLSALLPHYIHFQIFQCYMEAKASEHSARMVAMKNATDNAMELVDHLTLQCNKARQAMITNELLEISSAQSAMN
jgi:F-type H+-transporting ATPase subunit gamma